MTGCRARVVALRVMALCVVAIAATALAVPSGNAAEAPQRWRPPSGVVFNDPTGGAKARGAIVTRVRQAIQHTPRGATIRFATYSLDRNDVAAQLVRAHRRGVNVQVVANDNIVSDAERRLQKELGRQRDRASFMVFCHGSCRGSGSGNLHTKIYSFSATGSATDVLISSSANLAYGGAYAQWNDAYTVVGDHGLFRAWVRVFRELKRDRRTKPRYLSYSSPTRSVAFQRTSTVSAPAGGDRVVQRLAKIGCQAPRGYGVDGDTVVKIAMYAWYGDRGDRIARTVAGLQRRGCRVTVIGSVLGPSVARELQGAGIPVRAADWDFGKRLASGGDKIVRGPRCYSHYKFLTLNGSYDGAGVRAVWTGSENWSAISFSNDEVTLRLNGAAVHRRYSEQFDRMWRDRDATHAVGVEPTRRPCARS